MTTAEELKEMALDLKAGLPSQPLFQLIQTATGEIDYLATFGAYQMAVVLKHTAHIAGNSSPGVDLADEPQFHQGIQGAIHRG